MAALFYPGSKMLLVDNRINRCTCMVSDFTFTYFNYYIFISYPCLLFIHFYIVSFLFVYLKIYILFIYIEYIYCILKKFHDFETFRNFYLIIIYCSKRIFSSDLSYPTAIYRHNNLIYFKNLRKSIIKL